MTKTKRKSKMKASLKKKWVAALRSGKYAQTIHSLCHKDLDSGDVSYCCLGVLKKIVTGRNDYKGEFYGTSCGLSAEQRGKLVDLNDNKGKSFKQIAAYIEKNL